MSADKLASRPDSKHLSVGDAEQNSPPTWSVVERLGFEPSRLWPLVCVPAIAGILAASFAVCYNSIYENNHGAFRHHGVVMIEVYPQESGGNPPEAACDTIRLRDFLYYSYCMLVPGPPGDIAPNTTIVRLISVTESMCGVVLLVILVAVLGARRRV